MKAIIPFLIFIVFILSFILFLFWIVIKVYGYGVTRKSHVSVFATFVWLFISFITACLCFVLIANIAYIIDYWLFDQTFSTPYPAYFNDIEGDMID